MRLLGWLFALAGAVMAGGVHATDGVIEINHAKALAGGGYPVVISQAGSYRLTSNLLQPDSGTTVIRITAANVTLDLNGFSILGSNACSLPPVSCSHNGGGRGIWSASPGNVLVRNGAINGMGNACVYISFGYAVLQDLVVSHCGGDGISTDVGTSGKVHHLVARNNLGTGINLGRGEVADSEATWNGADGIHTVYLVRNSVAFGNDGYGIVIGSAGGSVIGSAMVSNKLHGLSIGAQTTLSASLISNNNSAGAQVQTNGYVFLNGGANLCAPVACP